MASAKKFTFKNVHAVSAKPPSQYTDLRNTYTSGEGSYVAASATYFSVAKTGGGGPVLVQALAKKGRIDLNAPSLNVNKGKVLDMKFSPFMDSLLATAGEDSRICITVIPDGGMTKNITQADQVLEGHIKKVGAIDFNPTSNNVLASASYDRTVRTWDLSTGENVNTYEEITDNVYSMGWNYNGSLLACTSKDKQLRVFDPRAPEKAMSREVFDGMKSSKLFWADKEGKRIGAVGFTKKAKRCLRIFDMANFEAKPLLEWNIDQASSVFMPYFDYDTKQLYLAGKGEGSISWYEIDDTTSKLNKGALSYRNSEPTRGGAWVPKRGLDVMGCEVNRFLKLEKRAVVPLSLVVPRKVQNEFQADIFPDTASMEPSQESGDFFKGGNAERKSMSLNPEASGGVVSRQASFTKGKSYQELVEENEQLRSRVEELEKELAALKS